MAETGIEDLIRGDGSGNGGGCGTTFLVAFIALAVLLGLVALIGNYCGPGPDSNSNMNVEQHAR